MRIIRWDAIKGVLPSLDLVPVIEAGFVAYSQGRAVVPPVGELLLSRGDVHIKYGYLQDDDYYVVKIASGFYGNPQFGLPSSNGLMFLFNQRTGELVSVLLDEGHLTNVRTAVAGAIAAKYLAPRSVERIGIVGTGTQARLQLEHLLPVTACRQVLVWGRGDEQLRRFRRDIEPLGYELEVTRETGTILRRCNLVVTATPATAPLLHVADLRPRTHITAVGSDTPEKQELDSAILCRADVVVADSIQQCLERGEIHHAIRLGFISRGDLVELGDLISGRQSGRTSEEQVTIADLTGVAVQDIQIAKAVYEALERDSSHRQP